jgi:hypothetical protein
MALRGRKPSTDFSPNEALFILQGLVRDGRVHKDDLNMYRQRMRDEAHGLLERLRALGWNEAASAAGAAVVGAAVAAAAPAVGRGVHVAFHESKQVARKVRRKVSAEVKAAQQLQGRYLSRIRQFAKSQRAKFTDMAKADGREAAIAAMDAELNKARAEYEPEGSGGRKVPKRASKKR